MTDHPAIYISAARKSSGKTMVSIGLSATIAGRGVSIQTFKKGPDYIDPMWLASASGLPCYNLDFHTQSEAEICGLFDAKRANKDVALIEGNKGLYDGVDLHGGDCNAALAKLLAVPVLLVVDCSGVTRGVAPLLNGYTAFDDNIHIAGVILNNVAGARHESKLLQVVEHYTDVSVLGSIQKDAKLTINERHLGLATYSETGNGESIIRSIRDVVNDSVDVDKVIEAASARKVALEPTNNDVVLRPEPVCSQHMRTQAAPLRIGIARDAAFGFYYADDFEAMRVSGAELQFFDTINDAVVPDVDALFIGGGFPETNAEALSANHLMQQSVREFVESGKPVYAECGGLMYLGRSLQWGNNIYRMTACIPVDCEMTARPVGRGYVSLVPTSRHPWKSKMAESGCNQLSAHEFHYSKLKNIDPGIRFAYEVERGFGVDGLHDGLIYGNIFASYAHLRHTAGTPWVHWFLSSIRSTVLQAA